MPLHQHETPEELQRALGWNREVSSDPAERENLRRYISLQLSAAGLVPPEEEGSLAKFAQGILENLREKNRLLDGHRAPIDERIESFLGSYFADQELETPLRVPSSSLVLDRHGMARELSLPADGHAFTNKLVDSRRLRNGVLNPPLARSISLREVYPSRATSVRFPSRHLPG